MRWNSVFRQKSGNTVSDITQILIPVMKIEENQVEYQKNKKQQKKDNGKQC